MSLGDLGELRLGSGWALVLDFDGTLAEIGPDPDEIWLPEAAGAAIEGLARRLDGAVAILSGRDLRDLARRTPGGVWRLGGHGLEVLPPNEPPPPPLPPPPEEVLAPLRAACRAPGVRLEIKGPVAALHFRAAPEAGPDCLRAAEAAARAQPGRVWQAGKMVVEVKPDSAHKGRALRALMDRPPFAGRRPLMLGDDVTDEDAMGAALDLGGLAVKVGLGDSVAALRTPDPAAVRAWLGREAA
ncbi:trehalose-phosphatase [Rubellimicrobium roseum]|uniref:Trehalose 6-phosphate phosphatase n=1 Tax=Rubellimicrobium roseum TaxID=687525 RepID=A0A5C4NEE6_9RHOB|nr:trehalose-phosphatase [Rubellimicrobium roseum]TNC68506.1 trehalose-phosphatase [Rubellimicrobium roseum]